MMKSISKAAEWAHVCVLPPKNDDGNTDLTFSLGSATDDDGYILERLGAPSASMVNFFQYNYHDFWLITCLRTMIPRNASHYNYLLPLSRLHLPHPHHGHFPGIWYYDGPSLVIPHFSMDTP